MRQDADSFSFGGKPLNSLRNLSPEYFSEDDSSHRPAPALSPEILGVEYRSGPFTLELPVSQETTILGNESLPVFRHRQEIIDAVRKNPYTIIVAETGAGKSTQVPQFLLDAGFDTIYQTQPRRVATLNVFERIRDEIGGVRGAFEAGNLVSYQTAVEHEGPENARIKVRTDGLQLVLEMHDSGIVENDVLIIDEVHEWNKNIEFLLAWTKKIIADRPQLRVVVMSATMDADNLAQYLSGVCDETPAIIEVEGRTFNVEFTEKPNSTVVDEVLIAANKIFNEPPTDGISQNGILVFEPGKREISDTIDEIRRRLPANIASAATILQLHSKQTVAEQQLAFDEYPGVKIVVATNVAQTSLTFTDTKYVIDSGYIRQVELDQEDVQGLVLHAKSQADCDQCRGRTGRVGDGFYILTKLNETTPHVLYADRDKYPTAEILRTDIVRNTLLVAGVDINIALLDLYHPIEQNVIERSQVTLRKLLALDGDNSITSLGKRMNQFPLSATSARMMVEVGRYPEQTRSYMAAIVAAKEVGGLQYFAFDVGRRWKDLSEEATSDMLTQLDIYIATQDMTEVQMHDYDLDLHNVTRAREQYRKIAKRVDALQEYLIPPTPEEREDLRLCITAGLVTNIFISNGGDYTHVDSPNTARQISNRSVVTSLPKIVVGDRYRVEYRADGELIQKQIIEHVTIANPQQLGKVAMHLCVWKSGELIQRSGMFMERRHLTLYGVDLGIEEEALAESSPILTNTIKALALEKSGPQQNKLRTIKRELENLQHLAKDPVEQLTHDNIISLVNEATPDNITDITVIDNNLRLIIQDRGITLDKYVSPERRARIIANAPEQITVQDVTLQLTYKSSKVIVMHYNPIEIIKLSADIFLTDGRKVLFMHKRKAWTLLELQGRLKPKVLSSTI